MLLQSPGSMCATAEPPAPRSKEKVAKQDTTGAKDMATG